MRLTLDQIDSVLTAVRTTISGGPTVRVYGSRLDDSARGGDLDLIVESDDEHGLMDRAGLKLAIEDSIQLPVDVMLVRRGQKRTAFQELAFAASRPLTRMHPIH